MQTIEERDVDRTGWPAGKWDSEPDKRQWLDEATGLPCLIVRTPELGHLCGYVGVPRGHAMYEKSYSDVHDALPNLTCHGGLTYSDHCRGRICHVVEPGEPDDVWWLGFDCLHGWDDAPGKMWRDDPHARYRDFAYVAGQCRLLAMQLADAK